MVAQRPSIEFATERRLFVTLSLAEKVRLLTGADAWSLRSCESIGLRPMVLSDGPVGVRGVRFSARDPSSSLPCPVALAATWDEELVRELAGALGHEARAKGVDVLLGPTINIIRTPLAGRGFECFSEDPVLTTRMAVGYVRGVQEAGVGAAAKHYVGNDSETARRTYDARIAEHVLREIYLPPFEACVAEADVAMVMAAYNSVNGATMTANPALIRDVLKIEWNFHGVVVSDWNATRATSASALAGLDLVMPGPGGPWGERLVAAVEAGEVTEAEIDDKLARLLRLAGRVGALTPPQEANTPFDDDDGRAPERLPRAAPSAARESFARLVGPDLLRRATARSFVLLRNAQSLLPLDPARLGSVAVIGPNAVRPQTQGGGSVRVLAVAGPTPARAIQAALGSGRVHVLEGCRPWTVVPVPPEGTLRDPVTGDVGVRFHVRAADGSTMYDERHPGNVVTWWDGLPKAVQKSGSAMVMRALYRATADGPHMIGAAGVGTLRIDVAGVRLAEASTLPPGELVEAMSRPPELRVPLNLRAGEEIEVRAECRRGVRADVPFVTMRLGIAPAPEEDGMLTEAVEAAAAADVAVVVIGSADGTESEGYDRSALALPGRQDELVSRVAAANPRTVVVVNSGMPVRMNWITEVAAAVQVWLPGQAGGEALADVLLGAAEPGGRLPLTMPRAETDAPVLQALPRGGELPYSEGLLVGYRGYDSTGREPLFCFGHGLGYTDWDYEAAYTPADTLAAGRDLELCVTVRNSGDRAGREIVQVYLDGPDDDPGRPPRALAAFAPVYAAAGASAEVDLRVPARAFARYDEAARRWAWPKESRTLRIGRSSRDLRLAISVAVE